jgi:hypothetical protein
MLSKNSEMEDVIPSEFYLSQNYPNPFSEKTTIKYCVAYKTKVRLAVFDEDGNEIEKLVDEEKNPGTYEIEFNAVTCHSREGGKLGEGTYLYSLEAGDYLSEKNMILER